MEMCRQYDTDVTDKNKAQFTVTVNLQKKTPKYPACLCICRDSSMTRTRDLEMSTDSSVVSPVLSVFFPLNASELKTTMASTSQCVGQPCQPVRDEGGVDFSKKPSENKFLLTLAAPVSLPPAVSGLDQRKRKGD